MAWSLFLRWSGIPNNLHDCVQNEGHEKTYQLMIANMAMSDLLYPIFLFPWFVAGMYMYVDSWPVSGRLGIKNLLEIFTWIRYHPCKISVYVFQELSPFMAQAYCAINPWLCLIFSVKYRQGLNKSHCRQGSPKSELEERWPPGGGTPIWNRRGCSSEIFNLPRKGDQSGRGLSKFWPLEETA